MYKYLVQVEKGYMGYIEIFGFSFHRVCKILCTSGVE